jgi:hypothetical protein
MQTFNLKPNAIMVTGSAAMAVWPVCALFCHTAAKRRHDAGNGSRREVR